jgi:hypothetical protein
MRGKPKVERKPYTAPSFRMLDAKTAKATLETKAVSRDIGASAMLKSISNSKADLPGKTTESPCSCWKSQFASPCCGGLGMKGAENLSLNGNEG